MKSSDHFVPHKFAKSLDTMPRKEAVLCVLGELQEATEMAGMEPLTKAALKAYMVLKKFTLPKVPCQRFPDWAGVDSDAWDLYPVDGPKGLLPLECKGGGNLLFDAVSMMLVGNTELSLELQVTIHLICSVLLYYFIYMY